MTLTLALVFALANRIPQVPQVSQGPQVHLTAGLGEPAEPARLFQSPEVIAEVRVHGNQIVTDAEVLKIAGVEIGTPYSDAVLAEITKRLKDSRKFESVEVLKRFASIEDASRIIVVIIVSEGPVRIVVPSGPGGPVQVKKRSFFNNLMFVPVLEGRDGYALSYGAQVTIPKPIGGNSRLSVPLTWGGTKRAAVQLDREFTGGPVSVLEFGSAVQRRVNPAYNQQEDRTSAWALAQRVIGLFRVGGTASWQHVTFGLLDDSFTDVGAEVTFDTRANPVLPRNAVLVTAGADRVIFASSGAGLTRTRLDASGFIGLVGEHVLVLHVVGEAADQAEPLYLRSIFGGTATVRGFKTGFRTGDKMVSGSAEWRIPVPSPAKFLKVGLTAFADVGTAYDHGEAMRDQRFYTGVGGSGWFSVASFHLSTAVGYGFGSGVHVHVTGGIGF